MNDLNKILGIYDVKVNVNCVKDDDISFPGIKEFNATITAFRNNYKYILNSLKYRHISNGPTEGFNNKIKVLKRISYGVRNFKYFRNRILMATA